MKDLVLSWHSVTLSKGGNEVMLKVVAATIPSYSMSIARCPGGFCTELERIMNGFWSGSTESKRNTHWLAWERMAIPKEYGGMDFRALFEFNYFMLCNQGWHILTQPNSLVSRILKARGLVRCGFRLLCRYIGRPVATYSVNANSVYST